MSIYVNHVHGGPKPPVSGFLWRNIGMVIYLGRMEVLYSRVLRNKVKYTNAYGKAARQ